MKILIPWIKNVSILAVFLNIKVGSSENVSSCITTLIKDETSFPASNPVVLPNYEEVQRTFPWIKRTFPECWNKLKGFLHQHKCQKQCRDVYSSCSMLTLFSTAKDCINLEKFVEHCGNMDQVACGDNNEVK